MTVSWSIRDMDSLIREDEGNAPVDHSLSIEALLNSL